MQIASAMKSVTKQPVLVVAVTSGKGGVGKTNISINLAAALSNLGNLVMLMDADFGLANIDVLLELKPRYNLSHLISGECNLADMVLSGPSGMLIVPASSGIQKMAHLGEAERTGLIRSFSDLQQDLDVLILDTASGISDNVVRFCGLATEVLVIVCDDPASIADSCSLIKLLSRDYGITKFRVVLNMIQSEARGNEIYRKLLSLTEDFSDITLDKIGVIPVDEYFRKSVQEKRVVVNAFPKSKSASALVKLANQVSRWPVTNKLDGNLGFFFERLVRAY